MEQWISVEDYLPSPHKKVLIYDGIKTVTVGLLFQVYDDGRADWYYFEPCVIEKRGTKTKPIIKAKVYSEHNGTHITHWMPLPNIPRKED